MRSTRRGGREAYSCLYQQLKVTKYRLPASDSTHYALKHSPDSVYQETKAILRGRPGAWTESTLDFPTCGAFAMTAGGDETPFRGWLVSGGLYEDFTIDGMRHICKGT